jgi:hypothetical protein
MKPSFGVLKGTWKGSWFADNRSLGDFELEIEPVVGHRLRGRAVWYSAAGGSAGFDYAGHLIRDELRIDWSGAHWIDLSLQEGERGQVELRGRYSLPAGGVVHTGDIVAWKEPSSGRHWWPLALFRRAG